MLWDNVGHCEGVVGYYGGVLGIVRELWDIIGQCWAF